MKKLFRSKKSEGLPNGPNYVNTTSEGFIITSNGQWEFPGQNTLIPSNNITMKGVPYPVFGLDDTGYSQMMYPGAEYTFPGNMVYEVPMMQSGGSFNPETDEFIGFIDDLPSKVLLRELGNINRYKNSEEGIIREPYKRSHEVYIDDNKGWRKVSPEQYEMLKQRYPGADSEKGWIKNTKKAKGGLIKAQVGKQTYANKQGVIMGPVKNPDGSFTLPISPEGLPQVNLPEYNLNLNSDPSYGPVTLEEYLNSGFNPLNLLLPSPEQGVIIRDAKGNITGESALSPSYPEMLLLPANIGLKGNLGKFVDAVNPLSGIGQKGRNAIGSALIANAIKKGKIKPNEVPKIQRIDPISRSSVNKQNDIISNMSKEDYENFLRAVYTQNREAFDNPLIEFKSSQPSSFVSGIGSDEKQGLLFKEKFCLPGSECAKTSNSVANRIYTDITGKEFDVAGNAHNAWHLEDQMTRSGAMPVYSREQLKVGDRLLMGNGVDQSTYVPGYTADPNIRHAGTYAGIIMHEGRPYQMLFESGRNNPMFINSIDYPITGPNSLKKAFRPQQFIDDEFGVNLVDKNIRYAYRDKPSVATYSSQNKAVQDVLSEGQLYRETIKRQYDITNDEFDELLNSLVGIGAQETKLNSALPASKLLKAKIALQDKLVNTGLSRPIKQAINTGKRALNTFSTKSNLPSYPGSAKIEMDAAKLAQQEGIPFNEALQTIKSQYAPKPRFIPSTVEPSKGMFRQKFQTESDRLADVNSNIGSKESLRNALGLMSENYGKVKQLYPDASPRQLMDLTTLMWNSPGKAKNKELVDFYLFGKNNPDPSRFNFDYLRKVNDYRNKLIDIQPKSTDDYLNLFRNNEYPEIQYKRGGSYNPNTDEFLGFID